MTICERHDQVDAYLETIHKRAYYVHSPANFEHMCRIYFSSGNMSFAFELDSSKRALKGKNMNKVINY